MSYGGLQVTCLVCGSHNHVLCGTASTAQIAHPDPRDTELARLRAEVEELQRQRRNWLDKDVTARTLVAQEKEIARLEADARRYRYWRTLGCGAEVHGEGVILHTFIPVRNISFQAEGIDSAIDAQLAAMSDTSTGTAPTGGGE